MYNESQKERYIAEKEATTVLASGLLARIFNKTESAEEELGKDVSQFTTAEILDTYKIMNIRSIDLLSNYNAQLSNYGNWCMQQNLLPDGINHFNEINIDILNTCVNKVAMEESIIDKEKLYDIVSRLKNPREQFVLMMLFETGKSKNTQNIFNARMSDIDKENLTMKLYDGRVVKISSRLLGIAENAAREDTYEVYPITYNEKTPIRELKNSGFIYRDSTAATDFSVSGRLSRLNRTMRVALEFLGVKRSWTKLNTFAESGTIYAIKEMQQKYNMTAKEVITDPELKHELENQHNVKIRAATTFLRKYKDVL